ncbi:hypothetical protein SAMN05216480_10558 [Pustulibacterium marinum]|uniref:Uncharacterized protein n=1 Tax=Pustulibacterium marinum TaxID=1224947 RepID=A0A1I7GLI7_9FLAO|nr:hypothetical protein [Pustulibacterium marinum]SFU49279.1 hypothetical protein SAMN05216480_10558 [Pustulibacterium marinum]
MPIPISPTPGFNPSDNNDLYFADWVVLPSVYNLTYSQGNDSPADINAVIGIKNFIADESFNYDSYRIKCETNFSNDIFAIVSGTVADTGENGLLLSEANLNTILNINFNGLGLLDVGDYSLTVIYKAYGLSGETEVYLEEKTVSVNLTVVSEDTAYVTPVNTYFQYSEGGYGIETIVVSAEGDFEIKVPSQFTLTAEGLTLDNVYLTTKTYVGSGSMEISVSVLNLLLFQNSITFNSCSISSNGNISNFYFIRNQEESDQPMVVFPEALEFDVFEGSSVIDPKDLFILTQEDFTVDVFIGWAYSSVIQGNGPQEIQVGIVSASNFSVGSYEGYITVSSGGDSLQVPIVVNVLPFFNTTFSESLNFTLDDHYVTVNSVEPNSIVNVVMSMKIYNYASSSYVDKIYKGSVPVFGGEAKFYPGTIIETAIKKLNAPADYLEGSISDLEGVFPVYKPAKVSISLEEMNIDTEEVINSGTVNNVLWLKGVTPEGFSSEGILEVTDVSERVTINSIATVSFAKLPGVYQIKTLVNDEEESIEYYNASDEYVFTLLKNFNSYAQGDVIEIIIMTELGNYTKKFIVFPDSKNSNLIAWSNEYGCLKIFEFTGDYTLKDELDFISNTSFKNNVQFSENLEILKNNILTINTGYVLSTGYEIISSLMYAKKVWKLYQGSSKVLLLNSTTTELENKSSDQELFYYDVEFKINADYVFQVFKF